MYAGCVCIIHILEEGPIFCFAQNFSTQFYTWKILRNLFPGDNL